MRLWSLHPQYLDTIGLIALWRELLLAKKVLAGKTKGYKNHPQLIRFRDNKNPLAAINYYLSVIYEESQKRNFNFNKSLIIYINNYQAKIKITNKQLNYEYQHFLSKIKIRNPALYNQLRKNKIIEPHPLFNKVPGLHPYQCQS